MLPEPPLVELKPLPPLPLYLGLARLVGTSFVLLGSMAGVGGDCVCRMKEAEGGDSDGRRGLPKLYGTSSMTSAGLVEGRVTFAKEAERV